MAGVVMATETGASELRIDVFCSRRNHRRGSGGRAARRPVPEDNRAAAPRSSLEDRGRGRADIGVEAATVRNEHGAPIGTPC